jgi:hypothetical protein
MKSCCIKIDNNKTSKCWRPRDGKVFGLPRRFTQEQCRKGPIRGFSMRSSCAPYKFCKKTERKSRKGGKKPTKPRKKTIKQFLYNPDDPKRSFDVYIDKNPTDTIPIKYTTLDDVKQTIKRLEQLYRAGKYPHKRIWQVGMILMVRLKVLREKKPREYRLAKKYFDFLGKRTKIEGERERQRAKFREIDSKR